MNRQTIISGHHGMTLYSFMPGLCPNEISQLDGFDETVTIMSYPEGTKKKRTVTSIKKQLNKIDR